MWSLKVEKRRKCRFSLDHGLASVSPSVDCLKKLSTNPGFLRTQNGTVLALLVLPTIMPSIFRYPDDDLMTVETCNVSDKRYRRICFFSLVYSIHIFADHFPKPFNTQLK